MLGLASDDVDNFLVWLELCTIDFQSSDSLDGPSQTEINFLQSPVFQEGGTPKTNNDRVGEGVSWEIQPGKDSGDGGESQSNEVCLEEREVQSDLFNNISQWFVCSIAPISVPFRQIILGSDRGLPHEG